VRIASLLPSSTEIVYELGLGTDLVAVSHDCDYPPDVANKVRLTSIDIDPSEASSRAINDWVAGKVHRGRSVYHLDPNLLKKTNPDVILTQELCEVCAPSFNEVTSACKILNGDRKIISLEPMNLTQILQSIQTVGEATGKKEKAKQLVAALQARIKRVEDKVAKAVSRPAVGCLEWLDPIWSAGHWVPEMVAKAGGVDKLAQPSQPSSRIEWNRVLNHDPEILIMMPCGFNLERTIQESNTLKKYAGWRNLRAVRDHQVFAVNGSAYFNRPGPRVVGGLEITAEILHPEVANGMAPPNSYTRVNL